MRIIEIPNCFNHEKCKNKAIGLVNRMWLCGPCIMQLQNKLDKLKEELVLEE